MYPKMLEDPIHHELLDTFSPITFLSCHIRERYQWWYLHFIIKYYLHQLGKFNIAMAVQSGDYDLDILPIQEQGDHFFGIIAHLASYFQMAALELSGELCRLSISQVLKCAHFASSASSWSY